MVAGFVPKAPVIPAAQPVAASVTGELKPLAGVMVMVDVPAVTGVALSVKLGAALTVKDMVVVALSVPLVPVTVSE